MTTHIINIATRFAIKSKKLPCATLKSIKYNQIHITDNGGNNATDIATHATFSSNLLNHNDKNATAHENKATNRSTIVGDILAITSVVKVANGIMKDINILATIATNILINNIFILLIYIHLFPVVIANANVLIGFIIGEINIAQTTTGIEFINNHAVAIIQDNVN